MSGHTTARVC